MAFIKNTAFEPRVTNNAKNDLANITGIFVNGAGETEVCSAGFLCVRKELAANEGYSAQSIKNGNTWTMKAAAATDLVNEPIYACNTYGVSELTDGTTGAVYKVGTNTLGLAVPAGDPATFTKIVFDGDRTYRWGIGNLSAAISSNTFFTIANGLLVPVSTAPTATGTPYFKLVGTGTFTQGVYNGFTYYDLEAHYAVAAA